MELLKSYFNTKRGSDNEVRVFQAGVVGTIDVNETVLPYQRVAIRIEQWVPSVPQ